MIFSFWNLVCPIHINVLNASPNEYPLANTRSSKIPNRELTELNVLQSALMQIQKWKKKTGYGKKTKKNIFPF